MNLVEQGDPMTINPIPFRDIPTDLSMDEIRIGMQQVIEHFNGKQVVAGAIGVPGYARPFSEFIQLGDDLVPVVPSVYLAMRTRNHWKGSQQIDPLGAVAAAKAVGFEIIETSGPTFGLARTTDISSKSKETHSPPNSKLRKLLEDVAASYDRHHPLEYDQPAQLLLKDSATSLRSFAPIGFRISGSGQKPFPLPLTPWIGFLNLDESTTFQEGLYVVYLFSEDLKHVYLSLNQGTEKLRAVRKLTNSQQLEVLRERARTFRNTLSSTEYEDLVSEIDLGVHLGRPGSYEAGNIAAIRYDTATLPPAETINNDLNRFLKLYDKVLQRRDELLHAKQIEPTGYESNPDKIEEAGLGGFKPKDDSDYIAIMPTYTLVKSRRHEALVRNFGEWVQTHGFKATTPHPVDIFLKHESQTWIVEAKIVYRMNYAQAVRGAIGQLFEYQHFISPDSNLIALFDTEVGGAYLELLSSLGITSAWPHPNGWSVNNPDKSLLALPFTYDVEPK